MPSSPRLRRRSSGSPPGPFTTEPTRTPIPPSSARPPRPAPSRRMRSSGGGVGDRDFALAYLYASAVLGTHLSRIGEEFVVWATSEFGLVRLPEDAATGWSMMPQKLNPDVAELVRGKAGS